MSDDIINPFLLPDILWNIFLYSEVRDIQSICCTSKIDYQPTLNDNRFWRIKTSCLLDKNLDELDLVYVDNPINYRNVYLHYEIDIYPINLVTHAEETKNYDLYKVM